jgi:hypothetical protein
MRLPLALLPAVIVFLQATAVWAQTPPAIQFPPFDSTACVAKPQRLLIIDMKSGWWSGDGGEFHKQLLPRIVKDCAQIEIEYYFLQYLDPAETPSLPPIPGVPSTTGPVGFVSFYPPKPGVDNDALMVLANFPSRPWSEYQQVWLMSGGDHDPTDWPTNNPAFQNLLAKFRTPAAAPSQSPSLFLAVGIGHHDHANQVLRALELPEMFQSHITELITPGVSDGSDITVFSRVRIGDGLTTHAVFEGVGSIADRVDISGEECDTDFLPVANHPFQIVGRNRLGEPSIAVHETDTRRMFLDAGMTRFYSLFDPAERDTYRYLQNTIKWLAK